LTPWKEGSSVGWFLILPNCSLGDVSFLVKIEGDLHKPISCSKMDPDLTPKLARARAQGDLSSKIILFVGLAYQGKDIIVFRFIIEYSSLRDFCP
jgi:hypothetical protein